MSTDGWCSGKSSIQPVKNPGFLESQVSARTMNDIITIISANLNTHSHVHTHVHQINGNIWSKLDSVGSDLMAQAVWFSLMETKIAKYKK